MLGELELAALLATHRLRGSAYGMTVRQDVSERLEREVAIGAVYNALERLERRGFVSSRKGEPTAERGGRAKLYYRIEAPGLRALNAASRVREQVWAGFVPQET